MITDTSTIYLLSRRLFEDPDIVESLVVVTLELGPILVEVVYDVLYSVPRLITEVGLRLVDGDLVVSKILNILKDYLDPLAHQLFHFILDHIANLADRVVAGGDVIDPAQGIVGLDSPQIGGGRIPDIQYGPPDRRIIDCDFPVRHSKFEHRIDNQIQSHPRAVSANGALPQSYDRETLILELQHASLALQFRYSIRIPARHRAIFVVQFIDGVAIDGAG